ncbi:MAG: RNA polymerase sigma factor RpoH [Alphaproteobacteria bacterium]|nr:RNA polymerase sigma factor RpoH [Alphaproteobacteria bacterium]
MNVDVPNKIISNLPVPRKEDSLAYYLKEIRCFNMLTPEEETELARAWRDSGDLKAAHKLVTSHLRLVAKIAMGYRGYGLPVADLIAEGNLGMMQAVKKFDPDRGFRLSTYAMWWIRAAIQEYILHSWSLVKIGTTAAQKKLFFNLRRLKNEMQAIEDGDLSNEQVALIAKQLSVAENEVVSMNRRLIGYDKSLNAPVGRDSEDTAEAQDFIADGAEGTDVVLAENQELEKRRKLLLKAMENLNDREKQVIIARRLTDTPLTLEELSLKLGVSRERVRQIEARTFEKLQDNIIIEAKKAGLVA